MPKREVDPHSGAIRFRRTDHEKKRLRMVKEHDQLKKKVSQLEKTVSRQASRIQQLERLVMSMQSQLEE